jgi:hypothetical protein
VIVIEILGFIAMWAAAAVDWRSDDVSRWSLALWSTALLALVVTLLALEGPE